MKRILDFEKDVEPECPVCHGEGWVCESHPDRSWGGGDGCCGGAGMPCRCSELIEKERKN